MRINRDIKKKKYSEQSCQSSKTWFRLTVVIIVIKQKAFFYFFWHQMINIITKRHRKNMF